MTAVKQKNNREKQNAKFFIKKKEEVAEWKQTRKVGQKPSPPIETKNNYEKIRTAI